MHAAWLAALCVACGGEEPSFTPPSASSSPRAPDPTAACRGGDHAACLELGGSADACVQLGLTREQADPPLALSLYLTACERGVLAGCTNAADPLRATDPPRAQRLARRACDGGDAAGCQNLGAVLQDALRWDDAAAAYRRGCDAGYAMSCEALGALAIGGRIEMPVEEAVAFLTRACDASDARACANLGRTLIRELDPPGGRAAFARACELGHPSACYDLALSLGRGEGGPVDAEGAIAAAQRGCSLGASSACSLLTR